MVLNLVLNEQEETQKIDVGGRCGRCNFDRGFIGKNGPGTCEFGQVRVGREKKKFFADGQDGANSLGNEHELEF